uniref:Membrane protein of ER body-like protein n=1 Tax=Musa acuminata subsp. malaccensis TaxID=214687 RepID=A0A804HTN6_MUSAM|nr:PREDICTED: membrane protein of ER body-like protein [Musa acuminata subsp. malaccensis]
MENGSSSQCSSETSESQDEMAVQQQIKLPKESKQKAVEFDLERILEEQDTHDLYCPICDSCITKKVILRKRKRMVQHGGPSKKVNEEKYDAGKSDTGMTNPSDAPEPDVFRCLSCFSFFMPTEGGFNIFQIFEKGKKIHAQSSPQVPEKPSQPGDGAIQITSENDQIIQRSEATATEVLAHSDVRLDVAEQSARGPETSNDWDVLKSIVYGGLAESIASLGVVSSAAAADASTLSIVALGLANLFGGFLLIIHKLFELRTARDVATDHEEDERAGRYWELLGRKANFRLHFVVVIISYLLVGSVPPVVYGFSFRGSDNKEHKLIAVAAASLLCIALLATGKAHVGPQRAYTKTLFHYLSLGVSASGVSYVAGVMANKLLEKFGLFDGGMSPPSPPGLLYQEDLSSGGRAWASSY